MSTQIKCVSCSRVVSFKHYYNDIRCVDCANKMNRKRPPLGIYPRFLHDEKRMEHIAEAIERFTAVGKAVPLEWIEEYDELAERVQKRNEVRI